MHRLLAMSLLAVALAAIPATAATFPWGSDTSLLKSGHVASADAHTITIATDEFAADLPEWMSNPRFTFYAGYLVRVAVDVSDSQKAWNACDAIYGKPIWFDDAGPVVRWVIPGEAIELRPGPNGHELVWAATVIPIPDTL